MKRNSPPNACVAIISLALISGWATLAAAQGTELQDSTENRGQARRLAASFEATGLAYGLAVGSPRIAMSLDFPLAGAWSIQASPAVSWGGEAGASAMALVLPVVIRFNGLLRAFKPYASAGLAVGSGRIGGPLGAGIFGIGPLVELGTRVSLFSSTVFIEPFAGFSAIGSRYQGAWDLVGSGSGGIRIGVPLGK
jgi:hypothetical protein